MEGRVDVGNDHNNGGYDGDCNDAVGKTLKRATPMATMVRVPKSVPRQPWVILKWSVISSRPLHSHRNKGYRITVSHGMRICIKRKKIHYGKFFDFCVEKCVYN